MAGSKDLRRCIVGAGLGLAGVLLLLAATPASARASNVYSFSDSYVGQSRSLLPVTLSTQRDEYCKFRAPKATRLGLKKALRNAERVVKKHSSGKARRKLAHSQQTRSENGALATAATATAAGRPYAALDALLRAHSLAPHDPVPLVGAAPLLVDAKLPNEALALLGSAAHLKEPKQSPFGVPGKAVLENNRGFAELALGKWQRAASSLKKASHLSPLLAEAKTNLAHADLCMKKDDQAVKMLFFGARRSPSLGKDLYGDSDGGMVGDPSTAGLDVSHGVKPQLPVYRFPATAEEGNYMNPIVLQMTRDSNAQGIAYSDQEGAINRRLMPRLRTMPPAKRRRLQGLIATVGQPGPAAQELLDRASEAETHLDDWESTHLGQGADCGSRGQWLTLLEHYDGLERAYMKEAYFEATGVAANIADPDAHQLAMLYAKDMLQGGLSGLLQHEYMLTILDSRCAPDKTPLDPVEDATDRRPSSPPCPTGLGAPGFGGLQVTFPFGQFTVDCENVAFELDAGAFIGLFGNVSHNFRNGSTTIFAGPRGKANPTGWGPNVTFKDGLYLTTDSAGNFTDVGARVETGAEITAGGTGQAFNGDSMNFSFAGVSPIGSAAVAGG